MSIFVGRKAHIGIHLEDDGDSGIAATPDVWLKRTAETSMDDAINDTLQNESDTGSIAHFNDSTISGLHGEGDVSTKLWFEDLYYILALAFGQRPTHTALADGAHQYKSKLSAISALPAGRDFLPSLGINPLNFVTLISCFSRYPLIYRLV